MPIKRILSDCPQCGKAEGQIISESLGYYTACHACGLTLAHYEKAPEIAAQKWNALATKLGGLTPDAPDNGICHCKYPTVARALSNPNCPVCGKPPSPVI